MAEKTIYDVIVVGGGPAGLTAAIYLARAKYRVLVLEQEQLGGQINITHEVVNYPGIASISGKSLTDTMCRQAENFGAEFSIARATGLSLKEDIKVVHTDRGDYSCFGILLATGAQPRTVGFQGEEAFKGRGVAYCATCDGEFFTGKEVFVVGGGYAAAEESVFLTKYAKHVTILMRGADFSCAASVADGARNHEKITVLPHTVIRKVDGQQGLNYLQYENTQTGEITEYRPPQGESFGIFVFAGYAPATDWLQGVVDCDEKGYLLTDARLKTSCEGVYGAGDVCQKQLRQVVTATADGAYAATELEKRVAVMHEKTGIIPQQPAKVQTESPSANEEDGLLSADMQDQLTGLFSKLEKQVTLSLTLDNRPVSQELNQMMRALSGLSDKIQIAIKEGTADAPCVEILVGAGEKTGLSFHGVPAGHEFTSFVLGIYNAAGPGQPLGEDIRQAIGQIREKKDMKILVSLSCTMCPDLVMAAQQLAANTPNVSAAVYDLQHFPNLRQQYGVMSVPCLVVNDTVASFGKKTIQQLLDILKH